MISNRFCAHRLRSESVADDDDRGLSLMQPRGCQLFPCDGFGLDGCLNRSGAELFWPICAMREPDIVNLLFSETLFLGVSAKTLTWRGGGHKTGGATLTPRRHPQGKSMNRK